MLCCRQTINVKSARYCFMINDLLVNVNEIVMLASKGSLMIQPLSHIMRISMITMVRNPNFKSCLVGYQLCGSEQRNLHYGREGIQKKVWVTPLMTSCRVSLTPNITFCVLNRDSKFNTFYFWNIRRREEYKKYKRLV